MHVHPPRTPSSSAPDGQIHERPARGPDTIVVGTYPPTRCGLATFTANTRRGLLAADPYRRVDVLRLGAAPGGYEPHPEVRATWPRGGSAAGAAVACAAYDVVLAQHEFGIYDGPEGASILEFADLLDPPLVSVLHTVLVDPSQSQRAIVEELAERSARLIVLSDAAAERLADRYRVDSSIVRTIPHGAELNLGPAPERPPGPPVVLTWGLLGPGKGIEHGIRAIARLARRGVRARYVIVGQTHPNVLGAEGERYRDSLQDLAVQLGVADLVEFDDDYRDWSRLHDVVRGADVVLLPYDSREQVTSGVLVEALASGKPIVATAFPHALEVVAGRAGIVVPHEEPAAMADALERLLTRPWLRERCAEAARREGLRHAWPTVGAGYDSVLREAVGTSSEA